MLVKTKHGTLKEIIYNETQLFQYGINRLAERDYLRQELAQKMKRLQPNVDIINKVLNDLTDRQYLNEARAIYMYLNKYAGKEALNKTKQRLTQKGANSTTLSECIAEFQQQQSPTSTNEDSPLSFTQQEAYLLLQRKYSNPSQYIYQKMLRFLITSRGYSFSDAKAAVTYFIQNKGM
jgi:SOS response regulatory protein OraA/RecX